MKDLRQPEASNPPCAPGTLWERASARPRDPALHCMEVEPRLELRAHVADPNDPTTGLPTADLPNCAKKTRVRWSVVRPFSKARSTSAKLGPQEVGRSPKASACRCSIPPSCLRPAHPSPRGGRAGQRKPPYRRSGLRAVRGLSGACGSSFQCPTHRSLSEFVALPLRFASPRLQRSQCPAIRFARRESRLRHSAVRRVASAL